jgi:DNA-binding GntR family transcriptional regulator
MNLSLSVSTALANADENLADRAYRLIENMIIMLELEPGAKLTEASLMARTGIGRTPVREAVLRLVSDRLMDVIPRRGLVVTQVLPHEVIQAFDLRLLLEPVMSSAAALNADDDERRRLTRCADDMIAAANRRDLIAYLDADNLFDIEMARSSRNAYLWRVMNPLRSAVRRGWYYYMGIKHLGPTAEAHAEIALRILHGDQEGAAEASRKLVGMARENVILNGLGGSER